MSQNENECIEKVIQGDPAAFESLVSKYQARLVAFLWNLLGSGEDARDAAQDAFIQAFARMGQFDQSRSFKVWLFAIAYNRGIDLLRRKRNFLRFLQRESAGAERIAVAAVPLEDSPLWQPLLRKVTPQERSVLALQCNEGYGIDEIAAALGCTESTVRVHLLNARRKLKKELQAAGFAAMPKKPNAEEAT
jgi:RNA polymerase sigma-70 factor (ECF subfamily)